MNDFDQRVARDKAGSDIIYSQFISALNISGHDSSYFSPKFERTFNESKAVLKDFLLW